MHPLAAVREYPWGRLSWVASTVSSPIKKHGGHNVIEYYLTLRMAEHLSMMENNDIGFAVRDYFIDVEKDWRARGGSLLSSRIVDLETLIDQRAEKKFQQLMTRSSRSVAVDIRFHLLQIGIEQLQPPDLRSPYQRNRARRRWRAPGQVQRARSWGGSGGV